MTFGIYLDDSKPQDLWFLSFLLPINSHDSYEAYNFYFAYPTDGVTQMTFFHGDVEQMRLTTKKDIKESTQKLLRRLLLVTETLQVCYLVLFTALTL